MFRNRRAVTVIATTMGLLAASLIATSAGAEESEELNNGAAQETVVPSAEDIAASDGGIALPAEAQAIVDAEVLDEEALGRELAKHAVPGEATVFSLGREVGLIEGPVGPTEEQLAADRDLRQERLSQPLLLSAEQELQLRARSDKFRSELGFGVQTDAEYEDARNSTVTLNNIRLGLVLNTEETAEFEAMLAVQHDRTPALAILNKLPTFAGSYMDRQAGQFVVQMTGDVSRAMDELSKVLDGGRFRVEIVDRSLAGLELKNGTAQFVS